MEQASLQGVLLPLRRPQYVSSPETLISALAWHEYELESSQPDPKGRRYIDLSPERRSGPQPIETRPRGQATKAFAAELRKAGLTNEAGQDEVVAEAVLNSVAGVRPSKAKAQPASPMTPALGLLQDPRGMLGTANPPSFDQILETMFQLGSTRPETNGVAARWRIASEIRMELDPLLEIIDIASRNTNGKYRLAPKALPSTPRIDLSETPYRWFHDSWTTLTTRAWVEALPPRVWVDWASTILRLALAMGFLWECERYVRVAKAILGRESDLLGAAMLSDVPELLPWPTSDLPVSSRNVRPVIRKRVDDGGRLRSLFERYQDRAHADFDAMSSEIESMQRDSSRPSQLKNLYETIFYSLVRRDHSDHYGLLQLRSTSIAIVQPGTEWVALIASLAAGTPGGETHVGKVLDELARLGLRPQLAEFVQLLEGAGLATGSADADHGVRVTSAY